MGKKRSFTQLKKSMGYDEFNKFCEKLTKEYASSEPKFARTYFTEHYNISIDCYYKVLEHAIVTNLVEDVIVEKMKNKALSNQEANNASAGATTIAKYARMYSQRYEYIVNSFSECEIKGFATDFGDNPDISKDDFASAYGVNRKVIELLLTKAIVENIADERAVDAIERRSIINAKPGQEETVRKSFAKLREKREAYKQGITLK